MPTALLLQCTCAALLRGRTISTVSISLPFSLSLFGRPSSIRVCCSICTYTILRVSLFLSRTQTRTHTLSRSFSLFLLLCLSLSLAVVSSSRWTPFFAPCCHTSMPLPAIRNVAAASPRYLRDVSYTASPSRMVSLLPACLRTTWAKEHAGRVCLLDAHAFLGGAPFRLSLPYY